MKYIEFGIGNKWWLRTETEGSDGIEYEEKGVQQPIIIQSLYLRVWVGKTVFILDSRDGFKRTQKNRNKFKFILGVTSR
ncbi:DUF3977 family protein [Marininema halotolerans]|uniref:DUF3977 domain-containing protein n=1 Tax=Marininema halotolerans TaxID=1155944 RepID=A0A1I6QK04_9BACL|nr:DUF3977 family protein [Marininema halotolerans]SFS52827.1 Protein of unknown function [Marininema halotolerans]